MSWKMEVKADNSGRWVGNELRFATQTEAEAYARHLTVRWTLVTDWQVVESEEPANYVFKDGGLERITRVPP